MDEKNNTVIIRDDVWKAVPENVFSPKKIETQETVCRKKPQAQRKHILTMNRKQKGAFVLGKEEPRLLQVYDPKKM